MHEEIHNCDNLANKPASFFFQEGIGRGKDILILGESLARNGWVQSGKAFYTPEGKLVPTGRKLNEELAIIGLKLEECAFTEIAKCFIGKNRKVLASCGMKSKDHLLLQLRTCKPKIVMSLGVVTKDALQQVFGVEFEMGTPKQIEADGGSFTLLPLYHPSPASPYGHGKNMAIMTEFKTKYKNII